MATTAQVPDRYTARLLAGSGQRGFGGQASEFVLDSPTGLAEDAQGNVFISDGQGVILRVRPGGVAERFAGTGVRGGDPGEGVEALRARVNAGALAVDAEGGLVYADAECRLRRIGTDGRVRTLAGIAGRCEYRGVGASPLETAIYQPSSIAITPQGDIVFLLNTLYQLSHVVLRLDRTGRLQELHQRPLANFVNGNGLTVDPAGNIYFSSACQIWRLDSQGRASAVAGQPINPCPFFIPLPQLREPSRTLSVPLEVRNLAWDRATGTLLAELQTQGQIVRLYLGEPSAEGWRMEPVVGGPADGPLFSPAPFERPVRPERVLSSARHGVLFTDFDAHQVFQVQNGRIRNFAGRWPQQSSPVNPLDYRFASDVIPFFGRDHGLPIQAWPGGGVLIGEAGPTRLLRWEAAGRLTPVAGNIESIRYACDTRVPMPVSAMNIRLCGAEGFAVQPDGTIFLLQNLLFRGVPRGLLLRIDRSGMVTRAGFENINAVTTDRAGRLYFNRSRTPTGTYRLEPGAEPSRLGEGLPEDRVVPAVLAVGPRDTLYGYDVSAFEIRRLEGGRWVRVVGTGREATEYAAVHGRLGAEVALSRVRDLAVDDAGNLWWTDQFGVRALLPDGRVQEVLRPSDMPYFNNRAEAVRLALGPNRTVYLTGYPGDIGLTTTRLVELTPVLAERIHAVEGADQDVFVGEESSEITVEVLGPGGAVMADTAVFFQVKSGAAVLVSSLTRTDAQGRAKVVLRAGQTPGPVVLTATASGRSADLALRVVGLPAPEVTAVTGARQFGSPSAVAAGGVIRIEGRFLADRSAEAEGSVRKLADVEVWIGQEALTLRGVSPGVVEAVLPDVVEPVAALVVTRQGVDSSPFEIAVAPAAPGILARATPAGGAQAMAELLDEPDFAFGPYGSGLTRPVGVGDRVQIQVTGLGSDPQCQVQLADILVPCEVGAAVAGVRPVVFRIPAGLAAGGVRLEVMGRDGTTTSQGLTIPTAAGNATRLFASDFEEPRYRVGPVRGQDGWTNAGPTADVQIAAGPDAERGGQVLRIQTSATLTDQVAALRRWTGVSRGRVAIAFDVWRDRNGRTLDFIALHRENFSGYLRWLSSGPTELTAASRVTGSLPLWVSAWHRIVLIVDLDARTLEAFANRQRLGPPVRFVETARGDLEGIWLNTVGPAGGAAYFDNLRVLALP